jgi:hypothetical protein
LYFTETEEKSYNFKNLLTSINISLPRNDVEITKKQEAYPTIEFNEIYVNNPISGRNIWISSDSLKGDYVSDKRVLLDRSFTYMNNRKFDLFNIGERIILRNIIYKVSVEVKIVALLSEDAVLLDKDIGHMRFHIIKRRWRTKKRKPKTDTGGLVLCAKC